MVRRSVTSSGSDVGRASSTVAEGKEAESNEPAMPTRPASKKEILKAQKSIHEEMKLRERQEWTESRKKLAIWIESNYFEVMMGLIILFNVIVVVIEANHQGQCETDLKPQGECATPVYLLAFNYILLVVYTVELVVKLYTYQIKYFKSGWNLFDFFVVVASILAELLNTLIPNTSFFRVARVARVSKFIRSMVHFPELYMIVTGFVSAMVSIFWASILLFFLLSLWSIIAVIFLHPLAVEVSLNTTLYSGCERCPRAFASVGASNLTFLQCIIAGDSWGTYAVPLIEYAPRTLPIFVGIIATISLGICNLILAVIVDSAAAARDEDKDLQLKMQESMELRTLAELTRVCALMDVDGSGTLTMQEIFTAFHENEEFQGVCKMMRIDEGDLESLSKIADEDGSGEVEYAEMTALLIKLKSMDLRTMLMFMKEDVCELRKSYEKISFEMIQALAQDGKICQAASIERPMSTLSTRRTKRQTSSAKTKTRAEMVDWTVSDNDTKAIASSDDIAPALSGQQSARLDASRRTSPQKADTPGEGTDCVRPIVQTLTSNETSLSVTMKSNDTIEAFPGSAGDTPGVDGQEKHVGPTKYNNGFPPAINSRPITPHPHAPIFEEDF